MNPSLRASFPRIFFLAVAGLLSVPGGSWAQGKDKEPKVAGARLVDGTKGTPVKARPVITDDDICLLAARAPAKPTGNTKAGAPGAKSAVIAQDAEKTKAEIAALQVQIKEKQRKIELLMQMFVTDERPFLNDPSGQNGDADAQAKRRYEQEELREQTAEIAQLRTRLEVLTAAGGEKAGKVRP